MLGKLTINNIDTAIGELQLSDIIQQLKNISEVKFIIAEKTNIDYFDTIIKFYKQAKTESSAEIEDLRSEFKKCLKDLFSDESKKLKLKELGATDLDLAIINNDKESIKQHINNFGKKNIYELAKAIRFTEISHEINKSLSEELIKKYEKIYSLHCEKNINSNDLKSLAIIIQNDGKIAWDYNLANYEYKNTKNLFDLSILYGTATFEISPDILKFLLSDEILGKCRNYNLDFAFIRIHMHDFNVKDEGLLDKIIEHFPNDLAKETLFVIQGCYTGRYHSKWKKKATLITSASDKEPSYVFNYNVEDLNKYFDNGKANLEGFIKFYSHYEGSTPHLSGGIDGNIVQNLPVWQYFLKTTLITEKTILADDKGNYLTLEPGILCSLTTPLKAWCITTIKNPDNYINDNLNDIEITTSGNIEGTEF